MSVYNEGNTKYRLQRLMSSRQYLIRSETFINGKALAFDYKVSEGQVDDETEAMERAVSVMRPKIARAEALARGEDPALPADPVIDRAIELEKEAKARAQRYREEAEAEALAIKEAAGQFLNEQNPLWGMF